MDVRGGIDDVLRLTATHRVQGIHRLRLLKDVPLDAPHPAKAATGVDEPHRPARAKPSGGTPT